MTSPELTRFGQRELRVNGEAFWLYRALPGLSLPLAPTAADATTRAQWFALGVACADLQAALRGCDDADLTHWDLPRRAPSVAPSPSGLQVIHRDFHAGNVLFDPTEPGRVTGYLDFDHLEVGPRLIDPVYASGSLLARLLEADPQHATHRWLALWQQLSAGWQAGWRAYGVPVSTDELEASASTLIEIELDFRGWLAGAGDDAGVELTDQMLELIDQHRDAFVRHAAG